MPMQVQLTAYDRRLTGTTERVVGDEELAARYLEGLAYLNPVKPPFVETRVVGVGGQVLLPSSPYRGY